MIKPSTRVQMCLVLRATLFAYFLHEVTAIIGDDDQAVR